MKPFAFLENELEQATVGARQLKEIHGDLALLVGLLFVSKEIVNALERVKEAMRNSSPGGDRGYHR